MLVMMPYPGLGRDCCEPKAYFTTNDEAQFVLEEAGAVGGFLKVPKLATFRALHFCKPGACLHNLFPCLRVLNLGWVRYGRNAIKNIGAGLQRHLQGGGV
jgi:hypothetical protein